MKSVINLGLVTVGGLLLGASASHAALIMQYKAAESNRSRKR